jgi:hypothetical protein
MALNKSLSPLSLFFVLQLMFLAGCSESREVSLPHDYLIFRYHSFYVIEHTAENPKGRTLLQIGREERVIITSVAYSRRDKELAVALTDKEPKKGTAIINFFAYPEVTLKRSLQTGKDRINGMDFNENGDLVFSAHDINRNNTGELCYVKKDSISPVILADNLFFGDPVWDNDSVGVYFPYRPGQESKIAYVSTTKPKSIKEIGPGVSVSVSSKGLIARLNDGKIFSSSKGQATYRPLNLPDKITDPRFTDSIDFVKGSDGLILQRYKKSTVYDLLITFPPYAEVNTLLPGVGMLDFEVAKK